MRKFILLMVLVFVLGFVSAGAFNYLQSFEVQNPQSVVVIERQNSSVSPNNDVPSPKGRVSQKDIFVYNDEVILKIDNPQWAVFTDSKSMDPVIDSDSKAIEIVPKSQGEIQVGDIVAYYSKLKKAVVIHRVIEIKSDAKGWYAIMKGDNNEYSDPEKVRFEQVRRIVVAVIY